MNKTRILAAMMAMGIMTTQASYVLLDNFESYAAESDLADSPAWERTSGTGSATIEDNGNSQVARMEGADGTGEFHTNHSFDLGANAINNVGTVFFQTTLNITGDDHALTFIFADTGTGLWNYAGSVIFEAGPGVVRARGNAFVPTTENWSNATTYDIWLVIDNPNNTFSSYIQGGVFTTQTQIASDLPFRNNKSVIDRLTINANRDQDAGSSFDIDNLYIDTAGANLENPTPPPAPPTVFTDGSGDGTWANAANWDHGVPVATNIANVAGNHTANLSGGTGTAKDLNVATVAGESATINNGSLNVLRTTIIGSGIGSSGTVDTVSFDTANLSMATGENAYGKLASTSMALSLPVLNIATGSNAVGVIEITTGAITVAGDLNLATGQDSTLTATLPAGALVLSATNNIFVGTGAGSSHNLDATDFAITGPIGDFEVGEGTGAAIKGLFSANDTLGSITVNTALELTSGTHTVDALTIAGQAGSTGSLNLSGSAVVTDSSVGPLAIANGLNSTATATLSITNVNGDVTIAQGEGSTATVHFLGDIHSTGNFYTGLYGANSVLSLMVDGEISGVRLNTAMSSNSVGTVVFDSCDLVTGGWHQFSGGKDSQSIVTGSSGLMSAGTVKVSQGDNSETTLVVTNGTLSANARLEVAEGSNSTATVQFASMAGATTNTAIKLATGVDSSGDLIIGSGLFSAKSLQLGNTNNGIATITVGGDMVITETIAAEAGSYIEMANGDFTWIGKTEADFLALWNAGTLRGNGESGLTGASFADYFQVSGDTATAGSVGAISISGPVAGNMEISWNSFAGRSYTVKYKTDLVVDSGWTTYTTVTGVGGVQTVPVPVDDTAKFYQVTTP